MMLRFIAFFLLFTVSLGGVPASAADPVYPLGSRVGFVPPPGFVASKHFPGYEHPDTKASMVLLTPPPQAYPELEKSVSPESLKAQGVVEEKRDQLTLSGGKALLVVATDTDKEKNQKIRKWMFLAQLQEGVVLVAVVVPEPGWKTITDDMIRASLKSLTVRPSVPMDEQMAMVPFKLNDLSGLHPIRVVAGAGIILTLGDKAAAPPTDQPFFSLQVGQGGPEQVPDRDNFARNLFTNLGDVKDLHLVSADMLRLGANGTLATHELQAEAKEAFTDVPLKLVQWVRFSGGTNGAFIRMLGIARADQWATAFPHFRAVRDGVAPQEN